MFDSLQVVEEIFNYLDNKVDPLEERVKQLEELLKNRFESRTRPVYTVATLPTVTSLQTAFASDGRKNGEGLGSGTGTMVHYDTDSGEWLNDYDNSIVQA